MRFIKYWLVVTALVTTSALSFMAGRDYEADFHSSEKDYQAACVLSDICHFAMDNCEDFEDIYCDYVNDLDCDSSLTITKKDLEKYYWCY